MIKQVHHLKVEVLYVILTFVLTPIILL